MSVVTITVVPGAGGAAGELDGGGATGELDGGAATGELDGGAAAGVVDGGGDAAALEDAGWVMVEIKVDSIVEIVVVVCV